MLDFRNVIYTFDAFKPCEERSMNRLSLFWKKLFLCFCIMIIFIPSSAWAQKVQSINLDLIPQRKVRHYIVEKEINSMDNYSEIHASWKDGVTDASKFRIHKKEFVVKDKLSNVWNCYKIANPIDSWNGHFVRFALLISKQTNSVMYTNNDINFSEVDTGQVYFLDLRLLKGLFNVPVAFEIIKVDTINKIMEFSYIDGNKSQGKQVLHFVDNGDGTTRIIHQSYFRSDSRLRDDFFYPYFHTKIIREFHRNMRRLVTDMFDRQKDPLLGKKNTPLNN